MASNNAKVGPQTLVDGAEQIQRSGRGGELIVGENHGRYYEAAYRNNLFYSYNIGTTLVAANTTYTGHVIWNGSNQTGSGVNLVLHKISLVISVTSASMTGIALGQSYQPAIPTGLTAASVVGNCKIGAAAAQGLSYKAATLTNAGANIFPLLHNTAAINTVGAEQFVIDLEGSIIIPPGYTAQLLALGAASASAAVGSGFIWEEVPV